MSSLSRPRAPPVISLICSSSMADNGEILYIFRSAISSGDSSTVCASDFENDFSKYLLRQPWMISNLRKEAEGRK